LANGQIITVANAWWRGSPREQAFLAAVFTGACQEFYTVLGPGSDRFHYNHIHLDLLMGNAERGHYCRPVLRRGVPVAEASRDPKTTASVTPLAFTGPCAD
jgi:hypothetical protein